MYRNVGILYKVDESHKENVGKDGRERIKKINNHVKKPVWINTRKVNNKKNILCVTINKEVHK